MTDQTAVDYRTSPPSIEPVATAWQAWWEDHDMWDGDMLYADLDTAKRHSAVAYVGEEYSWLPGDDPDDEAPDRTLAWELKYGRWRLLDNGQDTGVRLGETRTYAAPAVPAGQAPATDRAPLRTRIAEALAREDAHNWGYDHGFVHVYGGDPETDGFVDAVLAVLPASVDRAAEDAPLSPFYEHPDCGFRWHGRDGMDIPMRDGQPVCPRCELSKVEEQLRRRAAAPAAVSAVPGQADGETTDEARLARVREWVTSDVVTARNEFGNGYREAQRDIRDLITGAEQPAAGAQQPKEA